MFEYVHSSFPKRKRSPESQSSLKWNLIWNEVFSETRGCLRTLQRCGCLWIRFCLRTLQRRVFLWTSYPLRTLRRRGCLWTIRPTFDFPDRLEFFFVFKLFEGVVIFEPFDRPLTFQIDLNFSRLETRSFLDFFWGCSTEYYIIYLWTAAFLNFFGGWYQKQQCWPDPSTKPYNLKIHETYLRNFLKFIQFLLTKKIFLYYIKSEFL